MLLWEINYLLFIIIIWSTTTMYLINLIIIYDVANIFSMKNYKFERKLRVGVNRYLGVNWSTTTIDIYEKSR